MATTTIRSFEELAKVFGGNKETANQVGSLASYNAIAAKLGSPAAVIWAFLNNQETCKRYGARGEIVHNIFDIRRIVAYDEGVIIGAVMGLVSNGWAKFTHGGSFVRAA